MCSVQWRGISHELLIAALLLITAFASSAFQSGISPTVQRTAHTAKRRKKSDGCSCFLSSSPDVLESSSNSFISSNSKETKQKLAVVEPDMEAFSNGFHTVREEIPFEKVSVDNIIGTIPLDLRGTYYKVGPAMFTAGSLPPPTSGSSSAVSKLNSEELVIDDGQDINRMVKHPFDADGAIFAITFGSNMEEEATNSDDIDITCRYRYIRTVGFERERKKGTRLYNAMDATRVDSSNEKMNNDYPLPLLRHHLQPGLNKQRKNTSNTRVVHWGQKLISFWDGGLPYKLCSLSVSTEGKSQLGVLPPDASICSKSAYDSKNARMAFYGKSYNNVGGSTISIYEFNSKFRLVDASTPQEWKIPGYALINDGFALTSETWYVFIQPPVVVNQIQFMMSKDPNKSLSINPAAPATIYLIPRRTTDTGGGSKNKQIKSYAIPLDKYGPETNVHCINAFEQEEDDGTTTVYIDLVRSNCAASATTNEGMQKQRRQWPWMKTLDEYSLSSSKKSIWRYRITNVNNNVEPDGSVSKKCLCEIQSYFATVNPAVSGLRHRFIYASVGSMGEEVAPPQGIMKLDCDSEKSEVCACFMKKSKIMLCVSFLLRKRFLVDRLKTETTFYLSCF